MSYNCIICKEFVGERFSVEVKDGHAGNVIKAFVCKFCYDKFMDSHYNIGTFQLSRFFGWARDKVDRMRIFG